MAQSVANGVRALGETIGSSMSSNKKVADLQRDIRDAHSKQNTTTDFGTKVHDVDNWLKTADEKSNYVGPSLLEDQIGRERVSETNISSVYPDICRFIVSTMKEFLNVSYMREELQHMVISSSTRVSRTYQPPEF